MSGEAINPTNYDIVLVLDSVNKLREYDVNIKSFDHKFPTFKDSCLFIIYDFYKRYHALNLVPLQPVFDDIKVGITEYARRDLWIRGAWSDFKLDAKLPDLPLEDYIFGRFLIDETYNDVAQSYTDQDGVNPAYASTCILCVMLREL